MDLEVGASYRRYGPMVLRRCRRLLRDEARAVDAMHDVFVQLIKEAPRLASGPLSSLLYRMATNVCLNRLRTERRRPEDAEDELVLQLAHDEDLEARSAARALLARLFGTTLASTRDIAVMHLIDGMTHEEVAREVGLSVSGVRKRLRQLKSTLATLEER